MRLPARSPERKRALSSRGVQLATATALGVLVVLLVTGVIVLGLYEIHCCGVSAWIRP